MRLRSAFSLLLRGGRGARRAHVSSPTLSLTEILRAAIWPERDLREIERKLATTFHVPDVVLFASGRGALAAAVASSREPEVVVPAYTCVAVPNAVISGGATPRFVDVAPDGLLSSSADGDVVIVQDTYGFPAPMPGGPKVIRDCCHRADLVSVRGPWISVTSFEHSKWLSAGGGGLAVTWSPEAAARMRAFRDERPTGARSAVFSSLMLVGGRLGYRGWRLPAAAALRFARRLDLDRFRGQSESELEAQGVRADLLGAPSLTTASMICSQVRKSAAVAEHRAFVCRLYDEAAGVAREPMPLVRYPMRVADPDAFERELARRGWDVSGRWFSAELHPARANRRAFGLDESPASTSLARTTVNLPTHPLVTVNDAAILIAAALGAGARPIEITRR